MKIGPFELRLWRRDASQAVHNTLSWGDLPAFLGFGGATEAGVDLHADSAISHETVFSCVNVIAEDCAALPAVLMRQEGPGRRIRAEDHPLFPLLLHRPCPHMTAFQFWKLVFFEKLHHGNHYSLIQRDAYGRVEALWPLENGRVRPKWFVDPAAGRRERAYQVSAPAGVLPGGALSATLFEGEVFHVANLPILRGEQYCLQGASVWHHYLHETLGGALATNGFANRSFANGASMSGILSVDAALNRETAAALRENVAETYAGTRNAGKIGVFGHNARYTPVSQTNEQAQLLETRKYHRSVMAGILRVSAHLINDLEKATFSNVEHLDIGHYKHCLMPHLRDAAQTVQKDLLSAEEQRRHFVEHDATELLRGDQATLADVLQKSVQSAVRTPNEARAALGLPPDPDGDRLYVNGAVVALEAAAAAPAPGAAAKPPAAATPPKPADSAAS